MKTNNGLIFDENGLSSPDIDNAGFHNSIYREKNITSYLSDGSLWTRISSGKFDDLFVGDYFNVMLNDKTTLFRLAGFDTFLRTGLSQMTQHHAIIIPDFCLENAAMNTSGGTTGAYTHTDMHKTTLPKWVGYLETALGATHVLKAWESLTSSVDNDAKNCLRPAFTGASDACSNTAQKAVLLSETEVYGYMSYSSSGYENNMVNYGQLPLFRLNPQKITTLDSLGNRDEYWLRNVAKVGNFCTAVEGQANFRSANTANGVRPRFIIG